MADDLSLSFKQSIVSESNAWYKTLQRLGSGGNAATYLMLATSGPYKGIVFAVKVFRRISLPERRVKFLDEAAFLRDCDHPGIMRVLDEGLSRDVRAFWATSD